MQELIDSLEKHLQQFVGLPTSLQNEDTIKASAHKFLEGKRPKGGMFGYHISVTKDNSEILKVEVVDNIHKINGGYFK